MTEVEQQPATCPCEQRGHEVEDVDRTAAVDQGRILEEERSARGSSSARGRAREAAMRTCDVVSLHASAVEMLSARSRTSTTRHVGNDRSVAPEGRTAELAAALARVLARRGSVGARPR